MKNTEVKTFIEFTLLEQNVLVMSLECLEEMLNDVIQEAGIDIEEEKQLQNRLKAFDSIKQKLGI